MRCVCVDRGAVSDIPVRLLIAAVLTALVVPVFWSAYSDLSATMTEGRLERELQELISAVEDVMSGGMGSRTEVGLELEGWGTCGIEEVMVGGNLTDRSPDRFMVRYVISGSGEKRIAPKPLTAMTTSEGNSLRMSEGSYRISVTHGIVGTTEAAVLALED